MHVLHVGVFFPLGGQGAGGTVLFGADLGRRLFLRVVLGVLVVLLEAHHFQGGLVDSHLAVQLIHIYLLQTGLQVLRLLQTVHLQEEFHYWDLLENEHLNSC